jgi:hypothetical protein
VYFAVAGSVAASGSKNTFGWSNVSTREIYSLVLDALYIQRHLV